MENLLKIVTECIDEFSKQNNLPRLAAIIGGEAVIMHGIPRTTLDLDILCFWQADVKEEEPLVKRLALFLKNELGERYELKDFEASKDPFDPLKHDLLIITDSEKRFKKLDILIANYRWEIEGFNNMNSPEKGPLQIYPKPYLVGMKLMAGGIQDEEDIRNLFLIMLNPEKEKAWEIARLIRRDKNLSRILSKKDDSHRDTKTRRL